MLIMRYMSVLVMWGSSLSLAWGQTVTNGTVTNGTVTNGTVTSAKGNITEPTSSRIASTGSSTVSLTFFSTATLVNGTSASALSPSAAAATITSNLSRPITATIPAEFSNTAFTAVAPGATGTVVSGPNDSYIAAALSQHKVPLSMLVLGLSICAWRIIFQG